MSKRYPNLMTPIKVGNMTMKNRLEFSPMVCCLTSASGEVTTDYVNFIEMQAKTGVALITIGATAIDEETGIDFYGELNICRDSMIMGLARIADAAHRHGAKISAEMVHAGRNADPDQLATPYALAPTPLPGRAKWVKEMEQPEIDHLIKQYADCAYRLKTAGFDMCTIHGAHGNMVASWLSPAFNHRTDHYGGSFDNRCRLPLQILEAIRDKCGNDFGIEYRISGDEILPEGMRIEDTIRFLEKAQDYIDLVNCSRGLLVDPDYEFYTMPPYYHPFAHNVGYSEAMKKALKIPVSVVGSIKNPDMAEEILAAGKADMVAMARGFLADPDMLHKCKRGASEDVRPCLRCYQVCCGNTSVGIPISCAINPALGNEAKYEVITPSPWPKKAVVVGGGPAGMMAAQTLRKRGHEVVLFEASDTLGGRLNQINHLPFKEDLRQYTEWDIRTTMNCGADIRLNTKATPEIVAAENPDLLYLAVGADLFVPPIPGMDRPEVVDVVSVDSEQVEVGDKVVVCGAGMSGLECALGLAMKGKEVTVVDMKERNEMGLEIFIAVRNMLFKLLKDNNVTIIGGNTVEFVDDEGVHIMDHNWRKSVLPCDSVVTAFGMKPITENFEEFEDLVPETYIIGDCGGMPMSIANACYTAFHETVRF